MKPAEIRYVIAQTEAQARQYIFHTSYSFAEDRLESAKKARKLPGWRVWRVPIGEAEPVEQGGGR